MSNMFSNLSFRMDCMCMRMPLIQVISLLSVETMTQSKGNEKSRQTDCMRVTVGFTAYQSVAS